MIGAILLLNEFSTNNSIIIYIYIYQLKKVTLLTEKKNVALN